MIVIVAALSGCGCGCGSISGCHSYDSISCTLVAAAVIVVAIVMTAVVATVLAVTEGKAAVAENEGTFGSQSFPQKLVPPLHYQILALISPTSTS